MRYLIILIGLTSGTSALAVDKEKLTCPKEEFRRLNKAVGDACKSKPIKCEETFDCTLLKQRFHDAKACFVARQLLMLRCFGGGDEAHKKQLDQVQVTIEDCKVLFTAPQLIIQVQSSEPCKDHSEGSGGDQGRSVEDDRGCVRVGPVPGR